MADCDPGAFGCCGRGHQRWWITSSPDSDAERVDIRDGGSLAPGTAICRWRLSCENKFGAAVVARPSPVPPPPPSATPPRQALHPCRPPLFPLAPAIFFWLIIFFLRFLLLVLLLLRIASNSLLFLVLFLLLILLGSPSSSFSPAPPFPPADPATSSSSSCSSSSSSSPLPSCSSTSFFPLHFLMPFTIRRAVGAPAGGFQGSPRRNVGSGSLGVCCVLVHHCIGPQR